MTKVVAPVARLMFTNVASSCAFGLGMAVSVSAAVLWVMAKTTDAWLTNWIPVVLVIAFGLFIGGAHCLDVSEQKDRDDWK